MGVLEMKGEDWMAGGRRRKGRCYLELHGFKRRRWTCYDERPAPKISRGLNGSRGERHLMFFSATATTVHQVGRAFHTPQPVSVQP